MYEPDALPRVEVTEQILPVNTFQFDLEARFTIRQWAENRAAHEQGASELPHRAEAVITCVDDRDAGVVDVWRVALTGCPIVEDVNRRGTWNLVRDMHGPTPESIRFDAWPRRHRMYWVSQSGGVQPPEPSYDR